jgi:hypothetical protein
MVREVNSGLSTFCDENEVQFVDINKHITTETGDVKQHALDQ